MQKTEVLVIGAGPSGMISALCLAKLGIYSVVVERNAGVNEHPKAHELNTRSMEILETVGVSIDELIAEAAPFSDGARILFCNTINEEYGRIDLFADEGRRQKYQQHLKSKTPYLNLSQTQLEKILLQHINANPLIEIHFQHQWQSLTQNETGVTSEILERTQDKIFSIHSQYVLAADGHGSRCRTAVGIEMEGPDKIQDFVSTYFENDLREHVNTPAKLFWMLHPKAGGTFIAHHIEKRWVYMMPIYLDYEQKEDFTEAFMADRIKMALGNSELNINIKSIGFWHMSAQLASSYSKGRVFLVGDAAHRFPPTGGLGMNTGIGDAHNIAWKIKTVLSGLAEQHLLTTYESERRPIAKQNTEESLFNYHKIQDIIEAFGLNRDGLERIAKFKNTAPGKWLPTSWRDRLLGFAQGVAQKKFDKYYTDTNLKNKVLATIADQVAHFDRIGLDIGYVYEKGAIIPDGTDLVFPEDKVTEYIPSTRPGARFPHLALNGSSNLASSHDLLDYDRFTLLIDSEGSGWASALDQLPEALKAIIVLKQLDQLQLSDVVYQNIIALCAIEPTGAILIRPDAHVAWRRVNSEGGTSTILAAVLEKLLGKHN
ncbi:MAG: 2,4-dichlorophenol 6-monooxygenase [Saprospiraceae bacterium]|jgi:2,4-dichlorophenol 6-monooxygenase